jgi:acyl-CoA thioesterase FadM
VELEFKNAVALEDIITIKTTIKKVNRLRSTWKQQIFNSEGMLCNQATIEGVFVKNGKPHRIPKEILAKFSTFN